jgi:hypothetical protein
LFPIPNLEAEVSHYEIIDRQCTLQWIPILVHREYSSLDIALPSSSEILGSKSRFTGRNCVTILLKTPPLGRRRLLLISRASKSDMETKLSSVQMSNLGLHARDTPFLQSTAIHRPLSECTRNSIFGVPQICQATRITSSSLQTCLTHKIQGPNPPGVASARSRHIPSLPPGINNFALAKPKTRFSAPDTGKNRSWDFFPLQ